TRNNWQWNNLSPASSSLRAKRPVRRSAEGAKAEAIRKPQNGVSLHKTHPRKLGKRQAGDAPMPTKPHDPDTLAFYDAEAEAYAARGDRTDVGGPLLDFMTRLAPAAHVLDLGSGDGRHSAVMMEAGFEVTPLDGSAGLAAIASRRLGKPVRIARFDEIEDVEAFDAI